MSTMRAVSIAPRTLSYPHHSKRTSTVTATLSDAAVVVTLRGGVTVSSDVLVKLLDIEARCCTFKLLANGRICITPSGRLSPEEIDFLRRHRDEARRVLEYQADDSHLRS
jgi:hypothetical protein